MSGDATEHERGSTATAEPARDRPMSLDGIRDVYADQAGRFARLEPINRLLTGRFRRQAFSRAEGRVLDVACGTGTNRAFLPADVEYVGVDLSPEMLAKARERFERDGLDGSFREMDAEALAFDDDSFDTVISSLSTCTFPDPEVALREMSRVCRPDGRILLLEHGRSDVDLLARLQDWRADTHYEKHACRWNQEPLALVETAGLPVVEATESLLGIITTMEARPVDGD